VVAKLDALLAVEAIKDIPQNVNFAIRSQTLDAFLQSQNIAVATPMRSQKLTGSEIAEIAQSATLKVYCRKNDQSVQPVPQTRNDARYYYVWDTRPPDDYLSLRTQPSAQTGARIRQMPNGTLLDVLEKQADGWWRVRVVKSGEEGWALNRDGDRVWIYCCRPAQ
jgi:Bacterial SH3 domain